MRFPVLHVSMQSMLKKISEKFEMWNEFLKTDTSRINLFIFLHKFMTMLDYNSVICLLKKN